jgi:preprotein translocase subunit SecA
MSADAEVEKARLGARYEQDFLNKYLLLDMTDHVRAVRYYVPIREVLETQGHAAVTEFEKTVVLGIIDDKWKEHLRVMDELKENVRMAQFEQKDPLLIYKQEAYRAFMQAVDGMNKDMVSMLCRSELVAAPPAQQTPAQEQQMQQQQRRADLSRLRAQHSDTPATQRRQSSAPTHIQTEDGGERKLSRAERRMLERNDAKRGKK